MSSAAKKARRGSSSGGGGGATDVSVENSIGVLVACNTNMCQVMVTLKNNHGDLSGSSINAYETPNKDQGYAFMGLALHAAKEIKPTEHLNLNAPAVFKCLITRESKEKFDICFHTLSERKVVISIGEDGKATGFKK